MRKYILLFILSLLSIIGQLSGQSYNTAAGLRFGSHWGLTMQQRLAKQVTAELQLTNNYKPYGGAVDLTIQKHNPMITRRFNFYYGAGTQLAWREVETKKGPAVGLNLVGGAEMTIGKLNLSWDLTPTIYVYNQDKSIQFNSAVSARYVLYRKKWNPLDKRNIERRQKERLKEREKLEKKKKKKRKLKEREKNKKAKAKSEQKRNKPEETKRNSFRDLFKKKES